jgi:hypothetical protein
MAMSSGQECFEMAETLIVLAGANAWSAAREFGLQAALAGDADGAKYWRGVARAILRQQTARLGSPLEEISLAAAPATQAVVPAAVELSPPEAAPAEEPSGEAGAAEGAGIEPLLHEPTEVVLGRDSQAPIPLRARRQAMIAARGDADREVREAA